MASFLDETRTPMGLIDRYLGRRDSNLARWLLSRVENEVYLSIESDGATSWDYSQRMST